MTAQKKILICFTASYPYGLKETFFENEIPYLAEAFDKVIIFPRYNPTRSQKKRKLPANVICYEPFVVSNKFLRFLQGVFNLSPLDFYFTEFFRRKVYKSSKNLKSWLNSLLVFRRSHHVLRRFLKNVGTDSNVVLYSYWAEAPLFLTSLCRPYQKVVRMHRGDYYLDENYGYLPLRQEIYDHADLLIPISEHIVNDLRSSYGIADKKIQLHRLGTTNEKEHSANSDPHASSDVIRLVSCSRVDPVKRVHLIAEALALYEGNKHVEWHHFGDGLEFDQLKQKVDMLDTDRISVVLHGWASQRDIYKFYQDFNVTWLINVSASEGIPVSIMEAMSFGIPVIATDVGGTSEIVNANTGHLLDKSFDIYTLLSQIESCTQDGYRLKRVAARQIWENNYKANTNYRKLSQALRELI